MGKNQKPYFVDYLNDFRAFDVFLGAKGVFNYIRI